MELACDFFLQVLGRAIAAGPALSWCMAGAVMGVLVLVWKLSGDQRVACSQEQ